MKKSLKKLPLIIVLLLAACIYYYVTIPAFNIHATGTWMFLICGWAVIVLLFSWRKIRFTKTGKLEYEKEKGFTFTKLGFGILVLLVAILLIGSHYHCKKIPPASDRGEP